MTSTDPGRKSGTEVQLWGCGDASLGQLGPLLNGDVLVFLPIELQLQEMGLADYHPRLICASWQTTYIVLSCEGKSDRLMSMGSDDFGDLGIGKPKKKPIAPCCVKLGHLFIDGISLEDLHLVVLSIAAGQHHVIVQLRIRLKDGTHRQIMLGWGTARHGELGNVNNTSKKTSFLSLPQILTNIDASEVTSFSLGNQHSTFLSESKRVFSIGSNKRGQANGLEQLGDVEYVDCTWNGTYIVKTEDPEGFTRIYATGNHSKGQLGRTLTSSDGIQSLAPVELPPLSLPTHRLLELACGSEHVLALFSVQSDSGDAMMEPEVWGWGWNEHGNLGIDSTDDVHLPIKIWPSNHNPGPHIGTEVRAIDIWAGCGTSWIAVEVN
ncbi:RCC1/BLIP-II [Dendrothele bispora CBS 962.96]|uniref:RCC1/BLIP-II n=1 Tax=Dendrothele bispora (strain CBS 962.96) TaxID=1314807 RepID=A0A4S8MIG2_DENBC|nr:RCC1/BLIP-II [Dendrothele bispora CBS 962.96]